MLASDIARGVRSCCVAPENETKMLFLNQPVHAAQLIKREKALGTRLTIILQFYSLLCNRIKFSLFQQLVVN